MWKNIIYIFILSILSGSSAASNKLYCSSVLDYCMEIPINMIAINSINYKNHKNMIPTKIFDKFENGSKREIIIEDRETDPSFFIVDASKAKDKEIDIKGTCELLKKINDNDLEYCGSLKNRKGILATSYHVNELSYIRVWVNLNKRYIYIVYARRVVSKSEFNRELYAIMRIINSLK